MKDYRKVILHLQRLEVFGSFGEFSENWKDWRSFWSFGEPSARSGKTGKEQRKMNLFVQTALLLWLVCGHPVSAADNYR